MATSPSFESMNPDQWVEAMQLLREEVVEDCARILDTRTRPQLAATPLQQIFDRFNDLNVGFQTGEVGSGGQFSLEVRYQDETLLFWAFPSEEYKSLVYTDYDYWWFDHRGVDDSSRDRHQLHRSVALKILEMLPWANEDDLLEIAAIEIASRAGE